MPSAVTHLPIKPREPVVADDRAGFGALRAELHERCADQDLAELWAGMATGERRAVLASAQLDGSNALRGIADMPKANRDAIRAAIYRMSQYGRSLRDRLEGERPHPSRELAGHARQALAEGNLKAARHWLKLIEQGAV